MIITIDTQKDSAEDIRKIMSLLAQYTNQDSQNSYRQQQTQTTSSFFDMPTSPSAQSQNSPTANFFDAPQPQQSAPTTNFFDAPAQNTQAVEQPKIIFNLDDELPSTTKKEDKPTSQRFVLEPY